MVNNPVTGDAVTSRADAERRVIVSYARAPDRTGLAALLALDDAMAAILRTTTDPMVGQMRLTWWHGALAALDEAPAPAQPVLTALASYVVPAVAGADLSRVVEGWEELLDRELPDDVRLHAYADGRGHGLFDAVAKLSGITDFAPLADAGRGWALAELAAHTVDPLLAQRAVALAAPLLAQATRARWPRALRPLGAMTHLAAMPDAGGGKRIGRMLLHRLTGL